jgi:hypothetical protein
MVVLGGWLSLMSEIPLYTPPPQLFTLNHQPSTFITQPPKLHTPHSTLNPEP